MSNLIFPVGTVVELKPQNDGFESYQVQGLFLISFHPFHQLSQSCNYYLDLNLNLFPLRLQQSILRQKEINTHRIGKRLPFYPPGQTVFIIDCDISQCQAASVEAREGGSLVCFRSKLHHSNQGVLIWNKANRVDIIQCEVYNNRMEGAMVDTADHRYSNETVVRLIDNRVSGNGSIGISCGTIKSILIQVCSVTNIRFLD